MVRGEIFESENLFLRYFTIDDRKQLSRAIEASRTELKKVFPWVQNITDETEQQQYLSDLLANRNNYIFGIFNKNPKQLVGIIGIYNTSYNLEGEMKFWIISQNAGKGLATEACQRMLDICFNKLNLNRVYLLIATNNEPSRRVAEKCGFQKEGTLRQALYLDNQFHNVDLYAMLQSEFAPKEKRVMA
jgi:ribosomal-protein-serine acetyltransferase